MRRITVRRRRRHQKTGWREEYLRDLQGWSFSFVTAQFCPQFWLPSRLIQAHGRYFCCRICEPRGWRRTTDVTQKRKSNECPLTCWLLHRHPLILSLSWTLSCLHNHFLNLNGAQGLQVFLADFRNHQNRPFLPLLDG